MTHEALIAICDNYSFRDYAEPVNALRAVVELHKPNGSFCSVCGEELYPETYPCPTIEAIHKELK
jgi:hypothetical protein